MVEVVCVGLREVKVTLTFFRHPAHSEGALYLWSVSLRSYYRLRDFRVLLLTIWNNQDRHSNDLHDMITIFSNTRCRQAPRGKGAGIMHSS